MDSFYLIIIIILFALAVSDLIVGVSNDAVNFMNSAVGSLSAPIKVIMLIASLGIVIGATFSSGMMEVARKGIFHPEHFHFSEVMILFLAVMITDVILLDLFNTFSLPTSTTVSIVFELLGAAVGVALIKILTQNGNTSDLAMYINTGKALVIILGILLSVVISFTFGALIQYIVRLLFTFDYGKTYKYFAALWGGFAITAITYFILIKGAKGSSFITDEMTSWIKENTMLILLASFAGWTILLQLLLWLTRINILKFIVLTGTFALAMAFAGNDLVNFIGVPLAGFSSYKSFLAEGAGNPDQFPMVALQGAVKTPTMFLLMAGAIMTATLWLSKKARSITQMEISLARQDEGHERFQSTALSRGIVRISMNFANFLSSIIPKRMNRYLEGRFDPANANIKPKKGKMKASFDLVRASVNLTVASIIISFATSLKLPLSTTYVTFMVAMGSSLSDKAWGRESAVYRISGVMTVIAGWFFTAFAAFISAFTMAFLIFHGGIYAISGLVILIAFLIFRSTRLFKKRDQAIREKEEEFEVQKTLSITQRCTNNVTSTIISLAKFYFLTVRAFINSDRKQLKKYRKEITQLNLKTKELKKALPKTIKELEEEEVDTSPFYVQVLDYLREAAHCLHFINEPMFVHVDNNHAPLNKEQAKEIGDLNEQISEFYNVILNLLKKGSYFELNEVIERQQKLLDRIAKINKNQIKRVKKGESGTRISLIYFELLTETKNLLLHTVNILKSQRDFLDRNHLDRKVPLS